MAVNGLVFQHWKNGIMKDYIDPKRKRKIRSPAHNPKIQSFHNCTRSVQNPGYTTLKLYLKVYQHSSNVCVQKASTIVSQGH